MDGGAGKPAELALTGKPAIENIVAAQRSFFAAGHSLDVRWRITQLQRLRKAVVEAEDAICRALAADLGRSSVEACLCDVTPLLAEIDHTVWHLRRWARPELRYSGLMCFPSIVTRVHKMPYGVTLILSPFNFPFLLSLGPLVAAIAGGNTAVIKPSSKSKASTALLRQIIADLYDPQFVTVIEGGHDTADACLEQRFDKIFYTGSPAVGRHVMQCAAYNLTPVALELGGETGNWCLVRADADLRDAARKVAFLKLLNAGQICININQVAVASEVADAFVEELRKAFIRQIGASPLTNDEYPHLIDNAAYDRCAALADSCRGRIIFGGNGNPDTLRYEPTVIYPVRADEHIVMQELFNPLLPVVTYPDSEVAAMLDVISGRERPLAFYLFTKNKRWARRVMRTMQYGGGCVNEVCTHLMVPGAPFGGTGHSGMGAYHGIWGFREFTHPQTALTGSKHFNLTLREHPYTGRAGDRKQKLLHIIRHL